MPNSKTFLLSSIAALAMCAPAMALQVTVDLKHMDDPARDCERIEVRSELPKTKGHLNYVTYRGGCAGLEQRGGSEHASLSGDADAGDDGAESGGSDAGGNTGGGKGYGAGKGYSGKSHGGSKGHGGKGGRKG